MPIKFLLITGRGKVGFYLETGLVVYFPLSFLSDEDYFGVIEPYVLTEETVIGINLGLSEKINLNIGVFGHYSLTNYFGGENDYKGTVLGLQVGMSFKL